MINIKEAEPLFVPQEGKHKVPSSYLKQRQELPLDVKIHYTKLRIKQYYDLMKGKVYHRIAFTMAWGSGLSTTAIYLDMCPDEILQEYQDKFLNE